MHKYCVGPNSLSSSAVSVYAKRSLQPTTPTRNTEGKREWAGCGAHSDLVGGPCQGKCSDVSAGIGLIGDSGKAALPDIQCSFPQILYPAKKDDVPCEPLLARRLKKRRGRSRVSDRRLNYVRSASGGEPGLCLAIAGAIAKHTKSPEVMLLSFISASSLR